MRSTMTSGGHDWHPRVVVQRDGGGTGWWWWYRVGTNYSHLLSHDDRRVTERQEVDQGSTRRRRRRWTLVQNFSMLDSRLLGLPYFQPSYFQLSSFKLYFLQHFLIPASESVVSTAGALVVVTV